MSSTENYISPALEVRVWNISLRGIDDPEKPWAELTSESWAVYRTCHLSDRIFASLITQVRNDVLIRLVITPEAKIDFITNPEVSLKLRNIVAGMPNNSSFKYS